MNTMSTTVYKRHYLLPAGCPLMKHVIQWQLDN